MPAIGGSLESVTLDGRIFSVAADSDVQRKLGGFENENMPNGDGTMRLIQTRVAWQLDGFSLSLDDDRGDQEFLQALANRKAYFPIVATYPSGKNYQGTGQITGELQGSSQNATGSVVLGGPGELTSQ